MPVLDDINFQVSIQAKILLTVLSRYFLKYGHNQLLERSSGGVVDNAILGCLQNEADIQSSDK